MRDQVNFYLNLCSRNGIEDLRFFLDSSDFYTAPCSTKFHLNKPGGLVEHTLNVVKCADRLNKNYDGLYPDECIILAGLGHDLCKVNFYKTDDEPPTDAQVQYLRSLCSKGGVKYPEKVNKSYASTCIDHLKSMKPLPLPEFVPGYTVEDQAPLGHGEKSLFIMQKYVDLTLDEALAIRWHMATFDAGIHFQYPSGFAYNEAVKKSKLVSIITLADIEATNLMEV